jgi:hypothetical protein
MPRSMSEIAAKAIDDFAARTSLFLCLRRFPVDQIEVDPLGLACIARKSLEICDRCRLRQRNSPTTPENSAAFWREDFETVCFDSFILKQTLKQACSAGE